MQESKGLMNKLGETIQCAMCGVSMVRKSGKHMHCDACRVKRKNQRCRELYAQDKAQKNKSNREDIARKMPKQKQPV